ncbi:WD40-repeat-containing domain protein [Dissophora ornata]|nr:WD40-repeat-containing domain protein [Dissophora ornata]
MYQRPAVTQRISYVLRKDENRNAHLLGVNALALDTTTLTANPHAPASQDDYLPHTESRHQSSKYRVPGGILYTGGRDGMIAAWDLHFESPLARDIPGEAPEQPKGLPPSTFRQSFNHHTDWVNDIVLCHNGETLVSASSDRTVKLVRPHSHNPTAAHIIGTHGDYVKTLAYASGPGWLASGGLDKTVNVWDIKEGRSGQYASLGSIPETSSKASIYALACNPAGTVLATGSPEKVIRVWDPRTGQRITKFAGHTDNIRALLVSESGDLILSASSDTTIKLWSLTAQRCITTFTMHSDSVWSLYSDHPQLATFYGGGKDGLVTKTEMSRYDPHLHSDYEDEDPGQCVVICKADTGVARLVAHDNARIWTATSSSSVYQWPDIPTRANRSHELVSSIVPANLLKMSLNESTFADPTPEHYYPTSTVYSAASLGSLFVNNRDKQSQHSSEDDEGLITPIFGDPENIIEGEHGLIKHTVLNNRRMVVTEDKCGEVALWDIIRCVQLETFTGRKLDEVVNELNTIESVPTWCTIDTRIGALTVHLDEARCFDAEVYVDEIQVAPDPERPDDQRIMIGKWVLKNLFEKYVPVHIDYYEKEAYRLQHPDDPLVQPNVPTTVVTNEKNEVVDGGGGTQGGDPATAPTINTSPEGLKAPSTSEPLLPSGENWRPNSTPATPLDSMQPIGMALNATNSPRQGPVYSSATTATVAKLSASGSVTATPPTPSSPLSTLSHASASSSSSNGFMGRLKHSVKKLARTPSSEQRFENGRPISRKSFGSATAITIPGVSTAVSKAPLSPSIPENASPSLPALATSTLTEPGTGTSTSATSSPRTTIVEGTSSAGLCVAKPEDEQSTSDSTSSHSIESTASPAMQFPPSAVIMRPPQPPFTPPTQLDCPTVVIPAHIPVIISEQSREASSSVDLYRGSVGSLAQDYIPLVQVIPTWLLDVLLKNIIPPKEAPKVSFMLRPQSSNNARVPLESVKEESNESSGGASRPVIPSQPFTATLPSESAEPGASDSVPSSVQPNGSSHSDSMEAASQEEAPAKTREEEEEEEYTRQETLRPENWLEILCNDHVLSPTMTLATIRTHYWKTSSDVVLTYRYKMRNTGVVGSSVSATTLSSL